MRLTGAICVLLGLSFLVAQTARPDTRQKSLFVGNMSPIGMAIDGQGRVHLSWESTNVRLNYLRIGGGKTVKQVVDPTPQNSISGQTSAIVVDSTGSPQIAYWTQHANTVHGGLFYAHVVGADWQLDQIGQGFPVAMAIDAHDHPRIAVVDGFDFTYFHLEDAGWQSEQLPYAPNRVTSLVLDSAGHAHIGMTVGHPIYLTNSSGSWVQTQLDPNFAAATSVVLDSLEHPHVAMALEDVGTIRYRWFDGSEWQSEDLYDPNELPAGTKNAPLGAALALDAEDRPRILFVTQLTVTKVNHAGFNDTSTTNVLFYAYNDGVEWRLIPLAHGGVLEWTRLLVDPSGASQGAYAVGRSYLNETQLVRSVVVALPDVTGEWTSLSVTPEGAKVRVDGVLALRNEGPGRSRAAPIGLYLSNDAVLDGSDTAVAVRKSAPALAPGQTKSVRISFVQAPPLPATQLIAVVDPQGRLDDLDRPNNTIAAELPH